MQRYMNRCVCTHSIISASSTVSAGSDFVEASWFLHHAPLSLYLHSCASLSAHLPTFITSFTLLPHSSSYPLLFLEPVHHHQRVFSVTPPHLHLSSPFSSHPLYYISYSLSFMHAPLSSHSPYRSLPFLQLSSPFPISLCFSLPFVSLTLSSLPPSTPLLPLLPREDWLANLAVYPQCLVMPRRRGQCRQHKETQPRDSWGIWKRSWVGKCQQWEMRGMEDRLLFLLI